MKNNNKRPQRLFNRFIKLGIIFSLGLPLLTQAVSYEAIRLNNAEPIIEPSMFSNAEDGENINGPSLIRIPDWIPSDKRAHSSAQYYLYFADHIGDYIRMAWAPSIEGPYTLYNDYTTPGNRGVLDNKEADIYLDNDVRIEENHLASPDVIVDDINQRIIMYFHSGSSFFVGSSEVDKQVTWVSTSPYGLNFYDGIQSVHFGTSYFRLFEYGGNLFALDNGADINRALSAQTPWAIPENHDFTEPLWESNPSNNLFQDDITVSRSELRIRHTGARVADNQLHVFYSRRGDFQERIQLSTIELTADWADWDASYPAIEVLAPNPGWEGGHHTLANSETSAGVDVNQLRDPDVFEDEDGQLYLFYTGNGEGGIGIAKLYETPETDIALTATEDAHIKKSTETNFGTLSKVSVTMGDNSSDKRTGYLKFDLSSVSELEHAVIRLYAESTTGGPISIYETSSDWSETTLTLENAPSLGDVITTTYLTESETYYDWNITDYAKENAGGVLSVAFEVAPSNEATHAFSSVQSGANAAQLLILSAEKKEPTCKYVE